MSWAQRLKRVFHIDIDTCSYRSVAVKVLARIEDPVVIEKIQSILSWIIPRYFVDATV